MKFREMRDFLKVNNICKVTAARVNKPLQKHG
jgi:hypothetical protein